MAMPEKPSEGAERVHLQWNEGWETWQQVLPQYAGEPGVVTFIRATTHQRTLEALEFDLERLAKERDETLREMRRYLPIIEAAERDAAVWNRITAGTGIATANGYRAALARIKEET